MTTNPSAPAARDFRSWSDEDGNCWMAGHVEPAEFIADCKRMEVYCLGDRGDPDNIHGPESFFAHLIQPADVEHGWWRLVDAKEPEGAYEICDSDAERAEPYTVWYHDGI